MPAGVYVVVPVALLCLKFMNPLLCGGRGHSLNLALKRYNLKAPRSRRTYQTMEHTATFKDIRGDQETDCTSLEMTVTASKNSNVKSQVENDAPVVATLRCKSSDLRLKRWRHRQTDNYHDPAIDLSNCSRVRSSRDFEPSAIDARE